MQHDLSDAERFLRPLLRHWSDHGFGYWTVLASPEWWPDGPHSRQAADNDRVFAGLGGIQHHSLADDVPVLNVYFRLAPSAQGRGVAATILREAIRLAGRLAPGRDIIIRTRPANATVRRVAERAGFIDLGREPGVENMQLFRMAGPK